MIQRYRQRISGPLLDRIDLHVDVSLGLQGAHKQCPSEHSPDIRARVEQARIIQAELFKGQKGIHINSAMNPHLFKKHCQLDPDSSASLENVMSELSFSARAHDRILKVARILADLQGVESISSDNLLEAINYRTLDRNLWT